MDHEQLVDLIRRQGFDSPDAAAQALHATLQTLGERISKEEAQDLAAELPDEDAAWVFSDRHGQRFDVDELVARIARGEGVDLATAERDARIVANVLRRTVRADEIEDLRSQLPQDIRTLFDGVHVEDAAELIRAVAERAGIDAKRARRVTETVLEALAGRLPRGEVDDLITRLPLELHPALQRGRLAENGVVPALPVDEFVGRVASREGVSVRETLRHVRAVLAALRNAVGDEFFDVAVELPPDYQRALLPVPT
ncbi:MAG: hypothetical protein JWM05_14 [Acidimicrobiales bacterium]|nr:hypothetical protein [Acidimicrobiales bacterium]